MAFIDNIVKFHTFSKSTVRPDLTLGEAVNPSGHTVTSQQVRTDDIPAFINSFKGNKTDALTWAAENVDAYVRHNDILYYGENFNMGFDKPSCLIRVAKQEIDGKLVDLPKEQHTWVDFDLLYTDRANNVLRTTLKNADEKDVIAIHKDAKICYVHKDNNASTNSNQNSAFIKKADGTFLDHFVAPTDQFVGGQPSLGYGLCLFLAGYNSGKAFSEGESTYISNAFAGLIHFMTTRSESSDKSKNYEIAGFSVNCFEYIGAKLDASLSGIRKDVQDIIGTTMQGVVASVGVTDAAASAGISIDDETVTSPKIDITTATITDGIFASTTGNKAKLVTAADVESYVAKNAKVSVNGQEATTVTVAGTAQGSSDLVKVVVTEDKDTANEIGLTLTATADVATVTSGTITNGHEGKLVKAGDAKDIAETAISAAITGTDGAITGAINTAITNGIADGGAIDNRIDSVIDSELSATTTSGTIGYAIADAKKAGTDAMTEAKAKVSSVSGPTSGLVTVSTNSDTKAVTITVDEKLASTDDITLTGIKVNGTAITPTNKVADISAVTDVQSYASNGFEIYTAGRDGKKEIITRIVPAQYDTSSKAWRVNGTVTKQYLTTAADVETAIADAKAAITEQMPRVGVTHGAAAVGLKTWTKDNSKDHYLDIATSAFVAATSDKESEWKYTNYLATGASVQAAIGEVKAKINALHETPQFSVVVVAGVTDLTKWKEAVDGGIKKNTIYLVENTDAQDGSYIEYIAYESGAAIVTEKIGTTKTDLAEYAKDADVVKSIATANGVSGSVTNNVATITVQDGTTKQKGIVQLTDTIDATNSSYAVTGKAVASAISSATPKTYNEIKFGYNAVSSGTAATLTSFSGVELIDGVDEDNKPYHKLASGFITAGRYNGAQQAPICNGISSVENCYYTIATSTGQITGVGLINTMQVIDGSYMFGTNANHDYTKLTNMSYFASPLPILAKAPYMFYYSNLSTFDTALPSITDGSQMFAGSNNLKSFKSDLSTLIDGSSMFASCGKLEHFIGDLSSLVHAGEMFAGCKLDEESLMYIADSIKPNANGNYISIGMKNNINTLTANEIEYLNEIHNKGWHVYASGSLYSPIEPSGIMTLDENGEEKFTPIPFWAKAVPCEEKDARYIDNEGNFFTIVGGQLILVDDPETYGMFSCEADAAANMRLTKYVRPVEEETEEAE